MQSKRMYREIHVSTLGFNRGTLIRCCFIPDCLLIKLEVGVLVLGRVEIQRNKVVEIMIHKYFLLSLKLKLGKCILLKRLLVMVIGPRRVHLIKTMTVTEF